MGAWLGLLLLAIAPLPSIRGGEAAAVTRRPTTLEQIVREALESNPSVQAARMRWEAAKARVPQARAWEDPKLDFSSRVGRFVTIPPNAFMDQTLMIEQAIPLSGRNLSRGRSAEAEALAAYEDLRRVQLDVAARARATYFRLANAYAQLDVNRRNDDLLRQFADISRARFEAGGQTQADVLLAETESARITEARVELEQTRSDQETALNVLLNRPAQTPLGRPILQENPPALHLPLEQLQAVALLNRPEVIAASRRVEAAQARLELARREWVPDPAVRLQAQRYNAASQAVSELDLGVTINLPWLNRSKYQAEIREAQRNLEAARQDLEAQRTQTQGLVRDQLARINTFHHHLEIYRGKILPLARQTIEANQSGYESSKSGFLDLLTSQRNLQEAESTLYMHLSDYQAAVAELEALVGTEKMRRLSGGAMPTMDHHPK